MSSSTTHAADDRVARGTRPPQRLTPRGRAPARFHIAALGTLAFIAGIPFLHYLSVRPQDTFLLFSTDPLKALATVVSLWHGDNLGHDASSAPTLLFPYGLSTAAFAVLGLPTALGWAVWAGSLLFAAGAGMYVLAGEVLCIQPKAARIVAGVAYLGSPYVVIVLPGTTLWFVQYALLPYQLWLCSRAMRDPPRAVRYAALLGLLHGLFPALNLVLWIVNTAALCAFVAHGIAVRKVTAATLARPAAVALAFMIGTMAWWILPQITGFLFNTSLATGALAAETPTMYDQSSSILRALRMGGFWGLYAGYLGTYYYRFAPWYFLDPLIALAGYAQALCAFVPLLSRQFARSYSYFAALALLAIPMIVGAYPLNRPHPEGTLYLWLYTHLPLFSIFRDGYKFASLLALTYALGTGATYSLLSSRLQSLFSSWPTPVAPRVSRLSRVVLLGLIGGGLFALGEPLWLGQEYQPAALLTGIPAYWAATQSYLARQPGRFNVLVLPSQYFPVYRWGRPVTDVLDVPSASYSYVSGLETYARYGSADLALLLRAVDERSPQRVARLLTLLGIRFVVNRFDIDDRYYPHTLPPASIGALLGRTPGVQLDRRFGAVVIYRVVGAEPFALTAATPSLALAGTSTGDLIALSRGGGRLPHLVIAPPPGAVARSSARSLAVPSRGLYRLTVSSLANAPPPLRIAVDGHWIKARGRAPLVHSWSSTLFLATGGHAVTAAPGPRWGLLVDPLAARGLDQEHDLGVRAWSTAAYTFHLAASSRALVVTLNQTYSPGWQLVPVRWPEAIVQLAQDVLRPRPSWHLEVNGYANAWIVPPHRDEEMVLIYLPQVAFVLGSGISLCAVIAALWIVLRRPRRGHRAPPLPRVP